MFLSCGWVDVHVDVHVHECVCVCVQAALLVAAVSYILV